MDNSIAKALFKVSKHRLVGALVGLGFQHAGALVPVRKLLVTGNIMSFYHPQPSWEGHILIVPKKAIPSLMHLILGNDDVFLVSTIQAARQILAQRGGCSHDYVLCANGGPRQDVGQLHFHLYNHSGYINRHHGRTTSPLLYSGDNTIVFEHPDPNWQTHILIQSTAAQDDGLQDLYSAVSSMICFLPMLDRKYKLVQRGYTLLIRGILAGEQEPLTFHVVAGERRADRLSDVSTTVRANG